MKIVGPVRLWYPGPVAPVHQWWLPNAAGSPHVRVEIVYSIFCCIILPHQKHAALKEDGSWSSRVLWRLSSMKKVDDWRRWILPPQAQEASCCLLVWTVNSDVDEGPGEMRRSDVLGKGQSPWRWWSGVTCCQGRTAKCGEIWCCDARCDDALPCARCDVKWLRSAFRDVKCDAKGCGATPEGMLRPNVGGCAMRRWAWAQRRQRCQMRMRA